MITKADFNGSPHLSVFCLVNDDIAFVPFSISKKLEHLMQEQLKVDLVKTSVAGTPLIGIFACMNNSKIIVPDVLEKEELRPVSVSADMLAQLGKTHSIEFTFQLPPGRYTAQVTLENTADKSQARKEIKFKL